MVPFVQLIRLAIWLRLLLHVAPRSGFNGNLLNDVNQIRATATVHPSQHQFTARSRYCHLSPQVTMRRMTAPDSRVDW